MSFSFAKRAVGYQSVEQTLLIMTYELGKVIEYNHKARIYGATAYYSDANQQKEMSDFISMLRYYCEMKQWPYDVQLSEVKESQSIEELLIRMVRCVGDLTLTNVVPDLVGYIMQYCATKSWDYKQLEALGEQGYLERMEDILQYGK